MHEEMIDELTRFARENKLQFHYWFDEETSNYYFTFYNQDRTWGYRREISEEQLDLFNGSTVYFAYDIINTIRRTDIIRFDNFIYFTSIKNYPQSAITPYV
jgi:hypothetical protein